MFYLTPVCCVCFKIRETLRNLSEKDHDEIKLMDKFKYCNFEMNNFDLNIPLFICNHCYWSLNTAYSFKKTCVKNIENLKNYVAKLIHGLKINSSSQCALKENNYNTKNNADYSANKLTSDSASKNRKFYSEIYIKLDESSSNFRSAKKVNNVLNHSSIKPVNVNKENENIPSEILYLENEILIFEDLIDGEDASNPTIDSSNEVPVKEKSNLNFSESQNATVASTDRTNRSSNSSRKSSLRSESSSSENDNYQSNYEDSDSENSNKTSHHDVDTSERNEVRTKDKNQTKYNCSYCNKGFLTKNKLRDHILDHLEWRPYLCPFCNKEFVKKEVLKNHLQLHLNLELPHKCDKCNRRFAKKHFLERHLLVHRDQPFCCTYCGKNFSDETEFKIHIKHHEKENPFSCSSCDKRFKNLLFLNRHTENSACQAKIKSFKCVQCGNLFLKSTELTEHLKLHPKYTCTLCTASYITEKDLINHYTMEHPEQKLFQCKNCPIFFTENDLYEKHLLIHSRKNSFKCPYCTGSFERKSNFDIHLKTAHKTKKQIVFFAPTENNHLHVCKHCGEKFKQISQYKLHLLKHNPKISYSCQECGKKFFQYIAYKKHFTQHSLKLKKASKNCVHFQYSGKNGNNVCAHKSRRYSCGTCNKKFHEQKFLISHLRLENHVAKNVETLKPCLHCDKSYISANLLRKHIQIFHASKFYWCETCGENFIDEPSLKTHTQNWNHVAKKKDTASSTPDQKVLPNTGEKTCLKCPHCDKTYMWRNSLHFHIKNQHKAKILCCDNCGKLFADQDSLQNHVCRAHLNTTNKCCHCNKTYSSRESIIQHYKSAHNNAICICVKCGQHFKNKHSLNYHFRSTHLTSDNSDSNDFLTEETNEIDIVKQEIKLTIDESNIMPSTSDFVAVIKELEDEIFDVEKNMAAENEVIVTNESNTMTTACEFGVEMKTMETELFVFEDNMTVGNKIEVVTSDSHTITTTCNSGVEIKNMGTEFCLMEDNMATGNEVVVVTSEADVMSTRCEFGVEIKKVEEEVFILEDFMDVGNEVVVETI